MNSTFSVLRFSILVWHWRKPSLAVQMATGIKQTSLTTDKYFSHVCVCVCVLCLPHHMKRMSSVVRQTHTHTHTHTQTRTHTHTDVDACTDTNTHTHMLSLSLSLSLPSLSFFSLCPSS